MSEYKADYLIDGEFHVPVSLSFKDLKIRNVSYERLKGRQGKDSVILYKGPNNELKGKVFYITYDTIGNWKERAVLYFLPDTRQRVRLERRTISYFEG